MQSVHVKGPARKDSMFQLNSTDSRSNKTGAMIDVSGDRDTPKRLSDRIITISGQARSIAKRNKTEINGIYKCLAPVEFVLQTLFGYLFAVQVAGESERRCLFGDRLVPSLHC